MSGRSFLLDLGQFDPAALGDAGDRDATLRRPGLEQHRLDDHLAGLAAGEADARVALGAGGTHPLAGDRGGGLDRGDIGPAVPRPVRRGRHLLPEPRVRENVERPAQADAEPEPRVRDREVPAAEVAQVGQHRPRFLRARNDPQVQGIADRGDGVRPVVPAARREQRTRRLVIGEHGAAARRQQAAALEERRTEGGVVHPHHLHVDGRFVRHRLGQP
jgi:hypothetical protein